MGHSFGATTAMYTTYYDKRITGVCIALDPCSYILPDIMTIDETKQFNFPQPLLCINSDNFYERLYPWFENEKRMNRLFQKNINNQDKNINIYINKMAHAN